MPHKARFSRGFIKKEKLSSDAKSRVIEALREILVNPHAGVPLVGPLRGLWRARVGKYRIISNYEIDEEEKMVVFYGVDLRKRVY